jgi:uncharacterized protein (TIGR02266 family)
MSDVVLLFREFARLDRKRRRGLSPSELQRWMLLKRRLVREFNPDVSDDQADRRASVRVPTRLVVSFGDLGELRRCWMTNLSRGGLFVATDEVLEIGARLVLRIGISQTGDEVEIPVEVASHNLGPRFESQRGMGMRFLDMTPEVTKKLDDLYESAFRRAVETRDTAR